MTTPQAEVDIAPRMYVLDEYPRDKYVPLAHAGSGTWGVVYFSLNKDFYDSALITKTTNTFNELRSALVAVKVCPDLSLGSKEVKALLAIQDKVDSNTQNLFAGLVDHGPKWIATKAISPSISLYSLKGPVSKELVLHFVLEMAKACHFMFDICTPPMIHGDLHPGNMLIDTSYQTDFGFPGLVVIDFDLSTPADGETALEEFRVYSRFMISKLLLLDYKEHVEGWDEINYCLFDATDPVSFGDLINTLQAKLSKVLAKTTPERMHSIMKQIRKLSTVDDANIRDAFREAGLIE